MSLHELKKEKERQEDLADVAFADVLEAKEEIAAAHRKLDAAKMRWDEAKSTMTILDDKIAEMEDARESVLDDDETGGNVVRTTRKRGSGAQPYPAKRPQPFGRGAVGLLQCRQCNKHQPPGHKPRTPCVHCHWEPTTGSTSN